MAAAFLALLTLMVAFSMPVLAQAPAPQAPASAAPATPILDEQRQSDEEIAKALQALEALKLEADRIEAAIQREGLTDADLASLRAEIDPIGEQALAVAEEIAPKVQEAEARLEQLGSVPEEGEPAESELIAAERTELNERLSALQAIIKQAGLLSLRAEQISDSIVERRRTLVTDRIFKRHGSALNPVLWLDALKATPTVANRLWLLLSDWS
ncbi:MAG TPA: DUF3772 domain-containing protein, partial [Hyphomicrobiales bacterium]|nr:DUF3772 domain-containing protein [Hyphomicrobiales bacterium]